jgi:hypothetical protein
MKSTLAFLTFCAVAACALADDYAIRPSVWGTQKWPGGYDVYSNGVKVGEAKASVWGQQKWYGGYDVKINDRTTTQSERRALAEVLKTPR